MKNRKNKGRKPCKQKKSETQKKAKGKQNNSNKSLINTRLAAKLKKNNFLNQSFIDDDSDDEVTVPAMRRSKKNKKNKISLTMFTCDYCGINFTPKALFYFI